MPLILAAFDLSLLGPREIVLIGWGTLVGAAVGSFLNVVVYRLPLGKSLIHPPSACPRCGHPIRWHDNVPVLGWLWLGGKCRDCQAPIAPRYPLVEALAATLVAGLGVFNFAGGYGWVGWVQQSVLLLTLLTVALIEWDGLLAPLKILIPAICICLLFPIGESQPWKAWDEYAFAPASWWPAFAWQGVYGAIAANLAALLAVPTHGRGPAARLRAASAIAASTVVGGALGWVPGMICVSVTTLSYVLANRSRLAQREPDSDRAASWGWGPLLGVTALLGCVVVHFPADFAVQYLFQQKAKVASCVVALPIIMVSSVFAKWRGRSITPSDLTTSDT